MYGIFPFSFTHDVVIPIIKSWIKCPVWSSNLELTRLQWDGAITTAIGIHSQFWLTHPVIGFNTAPWCFPRSHHRTISRHSWTMPHQCAHRAASQNKFSHLSNNAALWCSPRFPPRTSSHHSLTTPLVNIIGSININHSLHVDDTQLSLPLSANNYNTASTHVLWTAPKTYYGPGRQKQTKMKRKSDICYCFQTYRFPKTIDPSHVHTLWLRYHNFMFY